MASLQESIIDPIEFSNRVNKQISKRRDTVVVNSKSESESKTDSILEAAYAEEDADAEKVPDVISGIYQSMSNIIEALNNDNAILNQQVDKLHSLLVSTASIIQEDLADVKKKADTVVDLQKQIMDTRAILLQTLDVNIKNLKKELSTENIRKLIREELKRVS